MTPSQHKARLKALEKGRKTRLANLEKKRKAKERAEAKKKRELAEAMGIKPDAPSLAERIPQIMADAEAKVPGPGPEYRYWWLDYAHAVNALHGGGVVE